MANRHDITEILLKVALNTIKQTNKQNIWLLTVIYQFDVKEDTMNIDWKLYFSETIIVYG